MLDLSENIDTFGGAALGNLSGSGLGYLLGDTAMLQGIRKKYGIPNGFRAKAFGAGAAGVLGSGLGALLGSRAEPQDLGAYLGATSGSLGGSLASLGLRSLTGKATSLPAILGLSSLGSGLGSVIGANTANKFSDLFTVDDDGLVNLLRQHRKQRDG